MIDKIIEGLEREKFIAFETLANTGDEKLDFAYLKVGNYADRAIGVVKQVAEEGGCGFCDKEVLDGNPIITSHSDGYISKKLGYGKLIAKYCPICGKELKPFKEAD